MKNRRRNTFWTLSAAEQAQVVHDAVTSDLMNLMEPDRMRVPLRGLLHAGGYAFDTGEVLDPFRILRYFDAALGLGRKNETPECNLSDADRLAYDAATAPALTEDIEEYILDVTASLPPKECYAIQHYIRAAHLHSYFKAYCTQNGLKYQTLHKAAMRGVKKLRANS